MNWAPDELKLIEKYENRAEEEPDLFYKIAEQANKTIKKVGPEIVRICLATAYVQKQKVDIKIDRDIANRGFTWAIFISDKYIDACKEICYNDNSFSKFSLREFLINSIKKEYNLPEYLVYGLTIEISQI